MDIKLKPVAWVKNERNSPIDDHWGNIISEIILDKEIPDEAFNGISDFSHLEIIYYFDKAEDDVVFSRRPRGNPAYPESGIFSQRNKDRPNHIGLCTVELISHSGRSISVKFLDAINGTPILDIKPVFKEYKLNSGIRQPAWVSDLMKEYFKSKK